VADERGAGGASARPSQESLLARFIELAAEVLGRQPTQGGAKPPSAPARSQPTPAGASDPFPNRVLFEDWSEYTAVANVAYVVPETAEDVVVVCNTAVKIGYTVRALGHSHNWSPLIVRPPAPPVPKVVLVDTSKLNSMSAGVVDGQATFGTGTTLLAATQFLEQQNNHGASAAPGYSFLNMPTVGALTLGGILAVGGHGTSVPFGAQQEPGLMGCLSNMIVSFKAVTTDPTNPASPYAIREFHRADADASAFLVHLGRAFITEVTLAAVPNYYLKLTNLFPSMADVMVKPPSPPAPLPDTALASLLDAHGRVEVIWFPYQDKTWVQCNTRLPQKPTEPLVPGPYNYEWMNGITWWESDILKAFFAEDPERVPEAMKLEVLDAEANMDGTTLYGTARDLEIYLTDNTLRMTSFGYVLQLPRAKVQAAAYGFYKGLTTLLDSYAKKTPPQYPVNGAVEIRCTTIDLQAELAIAGAKPPALAATHSVDANDQTLDTVLWVDVLTFPDAPGSAQFFVDLENWTIKNWGAGNLGRLRPEWSKGWAYTTAGPWTNAALIKNWIPSVYNAATDGLTFAWAKQTLAKYDRANIFTNTFLDDLFS
jgi:hypothetical protein